VFFVSGHKCKSVLGAGPKYRFSQLQSQILVYPPSAAAEATRVHHRATEKTFCLSGDARQTTGGYTDKQKYSALKESYKDYFRLSVSPDRRKNIPPPCPLRLSGE
jgi:hypothetical protein